MQCQVPAQTGTQERHSLSPSPITDLCQPLPPGSRRSLRCTRSQSRLDCSAEQCSYIAHQQPRLTRMLARPLIGRRRAQLGMPRIEIQCILCPGVRTEHPPLAASHALPFVQGRAKGKAIRQGPRMRFGPW